MSDAPAEQPPAGGYATAEDARALLGPLGGRIPATVSVEGQLSIARATVTEALHRTYGDHLPDFAADTAAAELLRWAEAKLAAAGVLSALLVGLPQAQQDTPARLRAEARDTLARPVPGFDPDAAPVDPDGAGPARAVAPGPVATSSAPIGSLFHDPYRTPWGGSPDTYVPRKAIADPTLLWWEA